MYNQVYNKYLSTPKVLDEIMDYNSKVFDSLDSINELIEVDKENNKVKLQEGGFSYHVLNVNLKTIKEETVNRPEFLLKTIELFKLDKLLELEEEKKELKEKIYERYSKQSLDIVKKLKLESMAAIHLNNQVKLAIEKQENFNIDKALNNIKDKLNISESNVSLRVFREYLENVKSFQEDATSFMFKNDNNIKSKDECIQKKNKKPKM